MKRPTEKLASFAGLIVYSMAVDSAPSGRNTPSSASGPKEKTYLAGSKALDSLAKLVQATESFFHPSNYGAWAPHLGRFLRVSRDWCHYNGTRIKTDLPSIRLSERDLGIPQTSDGRRTIGLQDATRTTFNP
jgi:hypothetical protein